MKWIGLAMTWTAALTVSFVLPNFYDRVWIAICLIVCGEGFHMWAKGNGR